MASIPADAAHRDLIGCTVERSAATASAGVRPEEIDIVAISHMHPDHLWGVISKEDDALTFPHAEYVVSETELRFWTSGTLKYDGNWAGIYKENERTLDFIRARVRTLKLGEEVTNGIWTMALPGHTPGQIGCYIKSDPESVLTSADVINNRTISFAHPDWGVGYDLDVEQGIRTRRVLLDLAAGQQVLVSSYHMPFPGLGRVAKSGSAYRWVPEEIRWQVTKPT